MPLRIFILQRALSNEPQQIILTRTNETKVSLRILILTNSFFFKSIFLKRPDSKIRFNRFPIDRISGYLPLPYGAHKPHPHQTVETLHSKRNSPRSRPKGHISESKSANLFQFQEFLRIYFDLFQFFFCI